MRGYHIRVVLSYPASTSVSPAPNTSTSFRPANILSGPQNFVPEYLFQSLPSHSLRFASRRNTYSSSSIHLTSKNFHQDYRFGSIRIDWADSTDMESGFVTVGSGKEREKASQHTSEPAKANFVPYSKAHHKFGSTILPEGVVHIFRQYQRPSDEQVKTASHSTTVLESTGSEDSRTITQEANESDDLTLAVLAVPAWMTPSDFLAFVSPASDGIAHLRMIRDSAPNRSIVILRFRETTHATEFAEEYNGKQFNSLEPEACHVVRVLSVAIEIDDHVSQSISRLSSKPVSGTYELPTCPVCLERMDAAVTGLVTVPCSHTFHCACLSKWGDSRCPVCRYSQTLLSSHPISSSRAARPIPFSSAYPPNGRTNCADCGNSANLWICLICGNIGCGRYGRAHAHAHYVSTTHLYALELETQRVWDYAGDGYVHRLIQNKADGKLVELPSAAAAVGLRSEGAGGGPTAADALSAEKIEAIGIEYSYLLTSQLDSQRTYYEEQSAELRKQLDAMRIVVEQLSGEAALARSRAREESEQRTRQDEARLLELEKERVKAGKRAEKASELARTLARELKEERAVSEGLLKNLRIAKEQAQVASQETAQCCQKVQELQDQVRDMMFYLEAKSKIESGDGLAAEAAGGTLKLLP